VIAATVFTVRGTPVSSAQSTASVPDIAGANRTDKAGIERLVAKARKTRQNAGNAAG
jgi:hypothetical protein